MEKDASLREKRPRKETYPCKKRPVNMERDRCTRKYTRKETYLGKKKPVNMHLYVKRNLEKRPMYDTKDLRIWIETDIHEKKRRKETYLCKKRHVNMERDGYTRKETSQRHLCTWTKASVYTTLCRLQRHNAPHIGEKINEIS